MDFSKSRTQHCAVLTALLCGLLIWFSSLFYADGRLITAHKEFLHEVYHGHYLAVLHPGIYWMSSLLSHLTPLSVERSLYCLLGLHAAATLLVIIWALARLYDGELDPYVLLLCALAVMVAAPVGLPVLNPSVYNYTFNNRVAFFLRNATHTAMLPYAIGAFGLLGVLLQQQDASGPFRAKAAGIASLLLLLSALIKPSVAITLVPAIALYLLASRRFSWQARIRIMSLLAPVALLILAQFYIGFISNPTSPHLIHLRLDPWTVWVNNNRHPLLSFVLATLFPLVVLRFRGLRLSAITIVAWINLGISLVPYILFNEVAGISTSWDRDFEWSYLHARQLLFLACVVEWWRWLAEEAPQQQKGLPARLRPSHVAGLLLVAHAMFGYVRLLVIDGGGL